MKNLKSTEAKNNFILFILCFIYIFIIGLFHETWDMNFVYYTFLSAIFLFSILTIRKASGKRFIFPIVIVISTWVSELLNFPILSAITGYLSTLFFLFIIFMLIYKVAKSKNVSLLEFLESINVYLLLGIAASVLFDVVYTYDHSAYNPAGEILNSQADFIYYSFVTMTTLGYGDISPANSLARSLSIFFSVAGQLYLTMIIAMLVGKYLSQQITEELDD